MHEGELLGASTTSLRGGNPPENPSLRLHVYLYIQLLLQPHGPHVPVTVHFALREYAGAWITHRADYMSGALRTGAGWCAVLARFALAS